jgi:hypothetical protein
VTSNAVNILFMIWVLLKIKTGKFPANFFCKSPKWTNGLYMVYLQLN